MATPLPPTRHVCHKDRCYDVLEVNQCFVVWHADLKRANLFRPGSNGGKKTICYRHKKRNRSKACPGGLLPKNPTDEELAEAVVRHKHCVLGSDYTGLIRVGDLRFEDVAKQWAQTQK